MYGVNIQFRRLKLYFINFILFYKELIIILK